MRLRRPELVAMLVGIAWPTTCIALAVHYGPDVALALAAATILVAAAYVWAVLPMRITCIRQRGLSTYWLAECRIGGCQRPRTAGRLLHVLADARSHTRRWHR